MKYLPLLLLMACGHAPEQGTATMALTPRTEGGLYRFQQACGTVTAQVVRVNSTETATVQIARAFFAIGSTEIDYTATTSKEFGGVLSVSAPDSTGSVKVTANSPTSWLVFDLVATLGDETQYGSYMTGNEVCP